MNKVKSGGKNSLFFDENSFSRILGAEHFNDT